jgi:hypothetical protein
MSRLRLWCLAGAATAKELAPFIMTGDHENHDIISLLSLIFGAYPSTR